MENLTLTTLRQQLFKILDEIIQTGIPVEIERRSHRLKIILDDPPSKLAKLRPHNAIVGDAEELVDLETDRWQDETQNCSFLGRTHRRVAVRRADIQAKPGRP